MGGTQDSLGNNWNLGKPTKSMCAIVCILNTEPYTKTPLVT